jgi:hypothetical protein
MTMRMGHGWRAACLLVLGCMGASLGGCAAPQRQRRSLRSGATNPPSVASAPSSHRRARAPRPRR